MSAHLHHGFLSYSGPRCTRRRAWGRTLAGVLLLVALAALTGWLWHCVRHATLVRVPGMAMLPLAVMDGHSAAGLACLAVMLPAVAAVAFWATRKLKRWDDELRAPMNDEQGEGAELAGRGGRVRPSCRSFPPPPVLVKKLPADDLRRILTAALKQAEGVRMRAILLRQHLPTNRDGRIDAALWAIRGEQSVLIGCLQGLLDRVAEAREEVEAP